MRWPLHSNMEADERELAEAGLSGLNDHRSPAYITRRKTAIFTRRSSYSMIFWLNITRSRFFYMKHTWTNYLQYDELHSARTPLWTSGEITSWWDQLIKKKISEKRSWCDILYLIKWYSHILYIQVWLKCPNMSIYFQSHCI